MSSPSSEKINLSLPEIFPMKNMLPVSMCKCLALLNQGGGGVHTMILRNYASNWEVVLVTQACYETLGDPQVKAATVEND